MPNSRVEINIGGKAYSITIEEEEKLKLLPPYERGEYLKSLQDKLQPILNDKKKEEEIVSDDELILCKKTRSLSWGHDDSQRRGIPSEKKLRSRSSILIDDEIMGDEDEITKGDSLIENNTPQRRREKYHGLSDNNPNLGFVQPKRKAFAVLGISTSAIETPKNLSKSYSSSKNHNQDDLQSSFMKGNSKAKLMKLMGVDNNELLKAEEESASHLLNVNSHKKSFRRKFTGKLKRKVSFIKSNTEELKHSLNIINLLLVEPIYCTNYNNNNNNDNNNVNQRPSFVLDTFIRQSTVTTSNSINLQEMQSNEYSAPVGLGMMHLQFDRWWQDTIFKGEALYTGFLYHNNSEIINKYLEVLILNSSTNGKQKAALEFIQNISNTSNYKVLEDIKQLDEFYGNSISSISTGFSSFALVSNLGELYIQCPLNHQGCCTGTLNKAKDWSGMITTPKVLGRRVKKISCSAYHYGIITDSNDIILWGNNTLPDKELITAQVGESNSVVKPPTIINGIPGKPMFISGGISHTIIVTSSGLYSCGSNKFGQLGRKIKNKNDLQTPLPILGITDRFGINCAISSISCGANHTFISSEDGMVFSWGSNNYGQLAHSHHLLVVYEPISLRDINNIISVACGNSHTLLLNVSGNVLSVGSNIFGELGIGLTTESSPIPKKVFIKEFIVKINAGPYSSNALTNHGTIYQWGLLKGQNMTQNQYTPRININLIKKNKFIVDMKSGITHTLFLSETSISKTIPILREGCGFSSKFNGTPLLKAIIKLSHINKSFQLIQERILLELQQEQRPIVVPKVSFLKVKFSSSRKGECFKINLYNPNDYTVKISSHIVNPESDTQQIIIEPDTFRITKKGTKEVKVLILQSKKAISKSYCMINFQCDKTPLKMTHAFVVCNCVTKKIKKTNLVQTKEDYGGSLQLVKNLGTYVPSVLLKYFTNSPSPPSKPNIQQFPAAILFLDISGFTSLNERLAQLGPQGPELVSKHINSYFASLIKAVSEHGGDVLKFAGDALICMWASSSSYSEVPTPRSNSVNSNDGDDYTNIDELSNEEQLKILTLRAIQCGFDIQTRLAKYDSNEGFSLTLHIGIGSGELLSLWVGSEGSWEYLVSGEPLAQLRTAVDNSKTGEVVISIESWELIKDHCKGEPRDNDIYIYEIVKPTPITKIKNIRGWPRADAEAALRCFIPLAVQVSLDSQHIQGWGNELRVATILFVKLNTDLPDDTKEIYLESINTVLCSMQQAIFKYEGMVRQFLADDKGTVLIAAFGLPPYSHMEDRLRGIKAALEIHSDLKKYNMDCSIGVTTGQVYCGSVGCPVRQEYAMVGDVVNLSARLMVAAFKENLKILCDELTYEGACESVSFKTLKPIYVKGKKDAIPIYQPLFKDKIRTSSRYTRSGNQIIGRNQIKKTIKLNINRVNEISIREKGSLILEGSQGMGKSLLIQYAMKQCKINRIKVCHGICDRFQKNNPFYPFNSIISDIFGITNIYSRLSTKINIYDELNGLSKSWYDSIPLLNDILHESLKVKENEYTKSLTKEDRIYNISYLLKHIISDYSHSSPFVIIIEDLHWVDSYSFTLISQIIKDITGVLFLGSCRSLSPLQKRIFKIPSVTHILVDPLSEKESTLLIKQHLQIDILPESLKYLFNTAYGNPLIIEEIATELCESGVITVNNRTCEIIGNLNNINLSSVNGMINTKLDRLQTTQQMVLKVASVIGFEFYVEILLDIFPFENNQKKFITGELDALERFGLIKKLSQTNQYSFVNQQILEVTYSRLTFAQRIELHENIVKYYESLHSNDIDKFSKLAYHLMVVIENSHDISIDIYCKCIEYLKKAGEVAGIVYGSDIARIWREKAKEVANKLPNGIQKDDILIDIDKLLSSSSSFGENLSDMNNSKVDLTLRELSGVGGPCQHLT